MRRFNMWRKAVATLAMLAGAACVSYSAAFAVTEYNVASLADFSGPYADVMPQWVDGRHAALAWWNDTVGSKLGVKVNIKDYDTRYDVAQTASLWPGVKSELHPIAAMGQGGTDIAALQQRLPDDGIVLLMGTASFGYAWKPNSWVFHLRATYSHEVAAFLGWFYQQRGGKTPVKFAMISSEAVPSYADISRGAEHFAKDNPKAELVETIWAEVQPTDLTTQVRRLAQKGTEVIVIDTNTAAVVAVKRALQALGKNIPIVVSSHNGLTISAKAVGGLDQLNGDFEVYGLAVPASTSGQSYEFYQLLKSKYGLNRDWNILTVNGVAQGLFTARAIEGAIAMVGPDKLTGAAVRQSLLTRPIPNTTTYGFLSSLRFGPDAPFPTSDLTVNIGTVRDGKLAIAASDVPVPTLTKW